MFFGVWHEEPLMLLSTIGAKLPITYYRECQKSIIWVSEKHSCFRYRQLEAA